MSSLEYTERDKQVGKHSAREVVSQKSHKGLVLPFLIGGSIAATSEKDVAPALYSLSDTTGEPLGSPGTPYLWYLMDRHLPSVLLTSKSFCATGK